MLTFSRPGANTGAYEPLSRLPGGGVYHAVAANANRSLVLFQVDLMGRVWQRTSQPDDSWSPATLVSRPEVGEVRSVAAESDDDGRIELFAVNTKGELWDFSQDATDGTTYRPPVRIGDNVRS